MSKELLYFQKAFAKFNKPILAFHKMNKDEIEKNYKLFFSNNANVVLEKELSNVFLPLENQASLQLDCFLK